MYSCVCQHAHVQGTLNFTSIKQQAQEGVSYEDNFSDWAMGSPGRLTARAASAALRLSSVSTCNTGILPSSRFSSSLTLQKPQIYQTRILHLCSLLGPPRPNACHTTTPRRRFHQLLLCTPMHSRNTFISHPSNVFAMMYWRGIVYGIVLGAVGYQW